MRDAERERERERRRWGGTVALPHLVSSSPRLLLLAKETGSADAQLYGPFNSYSRAVYAELIPPVRHHPAPHPTPLPSPRLAVAPTALYRRGS